LTALIHPQGHAFAEFAKETEPAIRKCLICDLNAPVNLPTSEMRGNHRERWYSNALLLPDGLIARFYLCPQHRRNTDVAWYWARTGNFKGQSK
jgi:hypothetical protein